MTVSTTTAKNTYSGNGSQTVFAYTFRILDEDEIIVQLEDADGNITTQTITTHYTVSGVGEAGGGNITFVTAPSATETVVLARNMSLTQETDYSENDAFPAETHETALDRLTMIAQQLDEEIDRSLRLPITTSITDATVAPVTATYVLRVNAAGNGLEFVSPTTAALATSVTPTDGVFLVGDGSAFVGESGSTARTSLGLGTIATQAANSVSITGGSITGITDITVADGGTGASTASAARTNLGVAIGTDVQAYDAGLTSIAGLTTAADRMIYTTASDTYAVTTLTSFARSILDDVDEATFKATVNLEIGTDVQAYDADLTTLASAFTTASASGAASLSFAEDTDNGSNTVTVTAPASVASNATVTLPSATTTIVGTDTTDTLTNKTIDGNNNTISNLVIGAEVTGASTALTDTADITYNADTDVSANGWVIDEDNMASNSAAKVPTQQSVKAYVDAAVVGGGGLSNVVEDTTPQLGGQLDVNGNAIGDGTLELLTFTEDAFAVNHVNIENEATGSGPIVRSAGDDVNVDLNLDTKGTGSLVFKTGGSSRADITASGLQLGGSGARVTTILDEDTMSSNSATALATQQSIKAYVDTEVAGAGGGATAWANIDGTGTANLRSSSGVSSLTDDGTGRYQINFSSTLASANYAAVAGHTELNSSYQANDRNRVVSIVTHATTYLEVQAVRSDSGAQFDMDRISIAVFI